MLFLRVIAWYGAEKISLKKSCFYLYIRRGYCSSWSQTIVSINAFKVEKKSELKVYAEQVGDYIIQPFIEGTEYTVDIFCDYDGNPISIVPRIRVAVRAGEVLKTKIVMDDKIIEECRKLVAGFQPCGPMTVQLIREVLIHTVDQELKRDYAF